MEPQTTHLLDSYSTPPPTHNFLDNRQRNRLVRSTRKLEAVLGTALKMAEAEGTHSPFSAPHSATDTRLSMPSRRPNVSYSDAKWSRRHASICSYPGSPDLIYASPSFASSGVSLTPLTSQPSGERPLREKCSMKLRIMTKRRTTSDTSGPLLLRLDTLPGMASWPEPSAPTTPTTPSTASFVSPSTPSTPTSASTIQTPTTPVLPTAAEIRRKRIAKLSRTLGEVIPPHLISASARPLKSASLPPPRSPLSPIVAAMPSVRPKGRARRSLSVDYGRENVPLSPAPSVEYTPWTTVQKSWVGEWNRTDIRDVQRELRTLRA